ncbi:recombinase family protein [Rhodococcus qingshengii]|uniref:recombinase family protein n=1 Tax=Rhodococcus qingshengii TaxID=334542 RepID=UPI0010A5A901|nr:recombinase family protein [Rhodococcus qingshengii]THJ65580.1 recombinase family protein [Rhodococcus qingshengii]
MQQHALRRAGAIRIFTDYESGSKTQCPQLTACLNYLRENDGDVLVVWKLDRLGRSVLHVIDTVHNLGERGSAFRFLAEGFGTTTAGGEFLFRIMAALAQMERRMIVERTMSASKLPTVMTPERSALVRALREQGKSLDAIASTLGVGRSPVSQVRADQSGSLRNSAMVSPNESNRAIMLLTST